MKVGVTIQGPHGTYRYTLEVAERTFEAAAARLLREGAPERGLGGELVRWWAPGQIAYLEPWRDR